MADVSTDNIMKVMNIVNDNGLNIVTIASFTFYMLCFISSIQGGWLSNYQSNKEISDR
jgi:hypothetical protein